MLRAHLVVRVHLVDPSAFTPPYDHALCAALARAGADVTLVTGPLRARRRAAPGGYAVDERFYRWSPGGRGRARAGGELAQHVPDMLALPPRGARRAPTSCTSSGSPSSRSTCACCRAAARAC